MKISSLTAAAVALLLGTAMFAAAAHEGKHFSAGEPGNPKKPARTVTVIMSDSDGTMRFVPDRLDAKKGEQVHFIIQNKGALKHEFTLASVKDNDKHAELMKKYPTWSMTIRTQKASTRAKPQKFSGASRRLARSNSPA